MNLSAPTFTCTDRMGRIILSGMEEIFGSNEISSVFTQAPLAKFDEPGMSRQMELDLSFERLPQLQSSLEKTYGLTAGRGLAIRSGRACFKHLLREFGTEMGLTDLEYRLLSLPARLKFSNQALAACLTSKLASMWHLRWTISTCIGPSNASRQTERCETRNPPVT